MRKQQKPQNACVAFEGIRLQNDLCILYDTHLMQITRYQTSTLKNVCTYANLNKKRWIGK